MIYKIVKWALLSFLAVLALAVILLVSVIGYFYLDAYLHKSEHDLSFVPNAFAVQNVLFDKQESWGWGPGGNETGVIVYELPKAVANRITEEGLSLLQNMLDNPLSPTRRYHNEYNDWSETPITRDNRSGTHSIYDDKFHEGEILKIDDYLDRYGFGLALPPEIRSLIDTAISTPGSFFAYGRIGLIIVIPKEHRVVYAYNG